MSTVDRIMEFVRAQPEMRVSLAELAALAGLSQSHFLRQFRLATGVTPHRFVVQERVSRALHLLSKTDMPASEVALSCGFSSQSHLGFAFRDIVGVTPRQFRQSCGRIK
jgi:AraC family transcriptional regulator